MITGIKTRRDDAVAEAKRQLLRLDKEAGLKGAYAILQRCVDEEVAELAEGYRLYLLDLQTEMQDAREEK